MSQALSCPSRALHGQAAGGESGEEAIESLVAGRRNTRSRNPGPRKPGRLLAGPRNTNSGQSSILHAGSWDSRSGQACAEDARAGNARSQKAGRFFARAREARLGEPEDRLRNYRSEAGSGPPVDGAHGELAQRDAILEDLQ